jgi:hypothetical protein
MESIGNPTAYLYTYTGLVRPTASQWVTGRCCCGCWLVRRYYHKLTCLSEISRRQRDKGAWVRRRLEAAEKRMTCRRQTHRLYASLADLSSLSSWWWWSRYVSDLLLVSYACIISSYTCVQLLVGRYYIGGCHRRSWYFTNSCYQVWFWPCLPRQGYCV